MKAKMWITFCAVFVAGVLLGGAGGRWLAHRHVRQFMEKPNPEFMQKMLLHRLEKELALKSEQLPQVEKIVAPAVKDLDQMFAGQREAFESRIKKMLKDLEPVMQGPEQKKALSELKVEDLRPGPHGKPPFHGHPGGSGAASGQGSQGPEARP